MDSKRRFGVTLVFCFAGAKDIEAVREEFHQTPLGLIRTNGLKAVVASKGD